MTRILILTLLAVLALAAPAAAGERKPLLRMEEFTAGAGGR